MGGQYKTCVIVVSYNTRDMTLACLDRFQPEAAGRSIRTIVVDNASSDGTLEAIKARYPDVVCIRSEFNLGFGGGNNLAMRSARENVLILLNADALASAETLANLAARMQEEPQIGALSPRLVCPDGSPQPYAYGDVPTLGYIFRRGARSLLGFGPMHDWSVTEPVETDWVSGACLCLRREALERVGLFDERFFMYFEDVDLCMRIHKDGWRIVYDPRFEVVHVGGASQHSSRARTYYFRSMAAFHKKYYGPLAGFPACLFHAIRQVTPVRKSRA